MQAVANEVESLLKLHEIVRETITIVNTVYLNHAVPLRKVQCRYSLAPGSITELFGSMILVAGLPDNCSSSIFTNLPARFSKLSVSKFKTKVMHTQRTPVMTASDRLTGTVAEHHSYMFGSFVFRQVCTALSPCLRNTLRA